MIVKHESAKPTDLGPGIERRMLAHSGKLMAVEFRFEKGAVLETHTHPHEQIGYVVEGTLELEIDGKKEIVKAGDTYYTAPDVLHGAVVLEDSVVFDVFTPQREDFLR